MEKSMLHSFIAQIMNYVINEKQGEYVSLINNSLDRLKNILNLYLLDTKYKNDLDLSLVDFLEISGDRDILAEEYEITDFSKSIGLTKDINGRLFVNKKYPNWLNSEFAKKTFKPQEMSNKKKNKYCLKTNRFVENITGYKYYKTIEQKNSVIGSLKAPFGYTVLVSMPTGGGKSLITQTISNQFDNTLTVVIVPTISLMLDQYFTIGGNDRYKGRVEYYNSSCNENDIICKIKNREITTLYLSPETLTRNNKILNALKESCISGYLSNLIIDEAHIIYEWGGSFRLDYYFVDVIRKQMVQLNKNIRTFLLSATFTEKDVENLKKDFSEGDNWIEIRCDSLRREIRYNLVKCEEYEKNKRIIESIKLLPHPMIVYANTPDDIDRIKIILEENGIYSYRTFTGVTNNKKREEIIDDWKNNKFQLMLATCAFGVGVNKKDVRTVLHTNVPDNVNRFYQEAGRGGRDGYSSLSVIIYSNKDIIDTTGLSKDKILTANKIVKRWNSMIDSGFKFGNSSVILDTIHRPEYLANDIYDIYGNDKDVFWNMYTIIFLKRYGYLDIQNIEWNKSRFLVTIEVKENDLLFGCTNIETRIENDRDKELEAEIRKMRSMIDMLYKNKKQCIADFFVNEYSLIKREYCAGCDYNVEVIDGYQKDMSLVIRGNNPVLSEESRVFLLITDYIKKLVESLIDEGYNTLVTNNTDLEELSNGHTFFNAVNIGEYFELLNNPYLLNGKIIIDIDSVSDLNSLISIINKSIFLLDTNHKNIVFVSTRDIYIESMNKNISEIVNSNIVNYK